MKLRQKNNDGIMVNYGNRELYNRYLIEIKNFKPLPIEEEVELFKRIKENGDELAIQKIMKHNLLFVVSVARHFSVTLTSHTLLLEDLINEGNLGLFEAIKTYEPTRGLKFISYAVWHIRKYIIKSLKDNVKGIRIPITIQYEVKRIKAKEMQLEQLNERKIDTLELFQAMLDEDGLKYANTFDKFNNIMDRYQREVSLSKVLGEDNYELGETIPSELDSPIEALIRDEKRIVLDKILKKVEPDVRNYILDYYGIDCERPLNMSEIGEKYNLTEKQVAYIMKKNMLWLKRTNKKTMEYLFH